MPRMPFAPLQTRLGKRLLGILITSTLLPIAVVGAASYWQVSGHLLRQSRERVERATKAFGVAIHDRLILAEAHLGVADKPTTRASALLRAVSRVDATGEMESLRGEPIAMPELTAAEREHLATGRAVVHTEPARPGAARALMIRGSGDGALVIGELDPRRLFGATETNNLPPGSSFCVFDVLDRRIACTGPEDGMGSLPVLPAERPPSGAVDWTIDGRALLAGHWSLFLKPRFHVRSWTVVVGEPRDDALAAARDFRVTLPLGLALALCVALLFTSRQLRRTLRPLEALQRGTRRIAAREFAARVELQSGDEFEDLAGSFNAMATQLARHFRTLETNAEIDRAVLAELDLVPISKALLEKLPDICPCETAAMVVLDGAPSGEAVGRALRLDARNEAIAHPVEFAAGELERLSGDDDLVLVKAGSRAPFDLEPALGASPPAAALFPLRLKGELLGVIVLGLAEAEACSSDDLAVVRHVSNQVAVALSNARMVDQIEFYAYFDALTGLPNRVLCRERLSQALATAQRYGTLVAVLFIDLDHFKRVNDTLGHEQGDELLRAVAERIQTALRRSDTVVRNAQVGTEWDLARLGGDEFIVMLTGIAQAQDAATAARRISEALTDPIRVASREIRITTSIGISIYPQDGRDLESLLKNADAAMYHAKEEGRGDFRFYEPSLNSEALERLTLENDLRAAFDSNQLALSYQPIIDLATERVAGAECLVRWPRVDGGSVSPADFIPVAEDTGLIVPLGRWILENACFQGARWRREGMGPVYISVNVSARQFRDAGFVDAVRQALSRSSFEPDLLVLEITEGMLMQQTDEAVARLHELKRLGLRLSIDDFGTGYSSLSYLRSFPVDDLKIDQSFVRGIGVSREDESIVPAIIAMAHGLGLKVVAEGIETREQLDFLRKAGCDRVQGYLYSRPELADAAGEMLIRGTCTAA